jgi:hypothetical protein
MGIVMTASAGIPYMIIVMIYKIKRRKMTLENNTTEEQMILDQVENMSNEVLANVVADRLPYEFAKAYLVKQMEPIMVKRIMKVPTPIEGQEIPADEVPEMEMIEQEMEVESVFRSGYIVKVPESVKALDHKYAIGDKVIYRSMRATEFDLVPGSAMIDPFDVICKEIEK